MTSPDKNINESIDEVIDLTMFADESFDTDDVDLFEFKGDDDSPLTSLKSVILSLDWEINDKILDELAEELTRLRNNRANDKVAQVYLQGLEKVGRYLKAEGSNAHTNAIKLLLTLYYNFEKISLSQDISNEEITMLLKSDIRKFKVLQYQIAMLNSPRLQAVDTVTDSISGITEEECESLDCIHATILGLEWEVTDEGLEKFNRQAEQLREELLDNTGAQILVQGLQALGAYINEEKIHAHPDAFTLLHSFYDGLKILVTDKNLTPEKRQEILIDKVGSLNSLKAIIAQNNLRKSGEAPDEIDQILDFGNQEDEQEIEKEADVDDSAESAAADEELSVDLDNENSPSRAAAAMETADEQYPQDILDPDAIQPIQDSIADDFIEEELKISSAQSIASSGATEAAGGSDEEELEEQLELLFDDKEAGEQDQPADMTSMGDDTLEISADIKEEEDILSFDDGESITPALADADEEGNRAEADQESSLDFEEKLDSLFDSLDENEPAPALIDENDDDLPPALSDTDEGEGFREDVIAADLDENSSDELQEKLDSFFGIDEEEAGEDIPDAVMEKEEISAPENEHSEKIEYSDDIVPALADSDEEIGFDANEAVSSLGDVAFEEIDKKLENFFDEDTIAPVQEKAHSMAVITSLISKAETVATAPEPENLKEITTLVATGKQDNPSAAQNVLLTLIGSTADLLLENPQSAQGHSAIITELMAGFEDAENPATLVEAVSRYTTWQLDFFTASMLQLKSSNSAAAAPTSDKKILSKVEESFSQLQELISSEFDALKKELQKK